MERGIMEKRFIAFIAMTACLCLAGEGTVSAGEDSTVTTKLHGYASFEAGEVVKGWSNPANSKVDHAWLQTGYMGIYLETFVSVCAVSRSGTACSVK
jgi:hypothetical protein